VLAHWRNFKLGLLTTIQGIEIIQDDDLRIHYVADLDDDVDGSERSYRLDNDPKLALDDIHASAGYPHSSWWDVLVRDPENRDKPYVDKNGYCISMTSYQRDGLSFYDRNRYVDAVNVPYSVAPGIIRKLCKGVLLGCASKITRITDGAAIDCVMADFSGYSIGEASDKACNFFDHNLSARNGDSRKIYRYEFWPGTPATIDGVTYRLQPAKGVKQ
jgi:hypothetical protein